MNKHMKPAVLSGLLAAMFSLSAHAGLYTFNYADSGAIPQGGDIFSVEHTIAGIEPLITSIEFILTFNSSASLPGGPTTGIEGQLTLGTSDSSPFVSFYPTLGTPGSGSQRIYDATFSGAPGSPGSGFNGLNPNDTWSLILWDNTTPNGIENGLVGWTLNITAVPEPVNAALGIFAGASVVALVGRSRRVRERIHRWCVAAVQWMDAV